MSLGLGGEIGAGDGLDPLAGVGFALNGLFQPRQGGLAELHDIAAGRFQAQLFKQGTIVGQKLRVRLKPDADIRPVKLVLLRKEVRRNAH